MSVVKHEVPVPVLRLQQYVMDIELEFLLLFVVCSFLNGQNRMIARYLS